MRYVQAQVEKILNANSNTAVCVSTSCMQIAMLLAYSKLYTNANANNSISAYFKTHFITCVCEKYAFHAHFSHLCNCAILHNKLTLHEKQQLNNAAAAARKLQLRCSSSSLFCASTAQHYFEKLKHYYSS